MSVRTGALALTVASALIALTGLAIGPASAGNPAEKQVQSIDLVGFDDTRFIIGGRPYLGPVRVTIYDDGITVTETTSIDTYLEGIAEMPFSWPSEALKAQAVAARTYLARRILPGRRGDAAAHDYDICATNRCQVYRGVQLVEGDGGERWRSAIESTNGEVLLYEGRPIEAVFTSMVGSRSRSNQDVWASDALPYLQAVDSPEIGIAPYAQWTVEVTARQFVQILRADGFNVGGELIGIDVDDPVEGSGRTTITVRTMNGTDSVLAPKLKGVFSRQGDRLYPGALPMRLEDGTLLPEPLLSYTYDIALYPSTATSIDARLPDDDRPGDDLVVFEGEGWGHGVGMSQWGARIMAEDDATYDQILSHYYSGLAPEQAVTVVPDQVVVGLATHRTTVPIEIQGTAIIRVNGIYAGTTGVGSWIVRDTANGLDLLAVDGPSLSPISHRAWPR